MDNQSLRASYIEPLCIARAIISGLWMVVASALIFVMCASLYLGLLRPPVYSATMTYAVSSKTSSGYSGRNVIAANEVASVLTELLQNGIVIDTLRNTSPELRSFSGTVSGKQVPESNFIIVTVSAGSPKDAFLGINALKDSFPLLSSYVSETTVIQVITSPSMSDAPSNQVDRRSLYIKCAAAGALLMIALIAFISVTRDTVQTRSGAKDKLDSPIIAAVRHEAPRLTARSLFSRSRGSPLVSSPTVSFSYVEQISSIRSRMEHEARQSGRKLYIITSVSEHEGKSTLAANLAVSLAQHGRKVALIDADLRKPSQNGIFGGSYNAALPLEQLLSEPFTVKRFNDCAKLVPETKILQLFPVEPDRRCTELLSGGTMRSLLEYLSPLDFVIIDTPPLGMFPDAELLADMSDASILVVRQDCTPAADINDAVDALRSCKAEYLGCVLNDMRGIASSGYGYGYGYGYGRKYGYGKYGYGYAKSDGGSRSDPKAKG